MMQLSAHEVYDLHELAMSCVNSITNMACFINQAKDPELKAILQRHFPLHVQDYNIKVEYLNKHAGASNQFQVPPLSQKNISLDQINVQPIQPRTDVQQFNDREIATAYLLTLKRAGREYAWAAMECSNAELRSFLEKAFQMSSHHAYEIWQWMVQKGYYPVQAVQDTTIQFYSGAYQQTKEPATV
jgi:spore coat protein CotF